MKKLDCCVFWQNVDLMLSTVIFCGKKEERNQKIKPFAHLTTFKKKFPLILA